MASPSPAPDASGAVPQAGLAVEHEEQRDQPGHDHRHPHKLTEMHGDPRPAVRILGERRCRNLQMGCHPSDQSVNRFVHIRERPPGMA